MTNLRYRERRLKTYMLGRLSISWVMKYLLAATLVAVSACFAGCQSTLGTASPPALPLRVDHRQWPAADGQTHYRDEFYRGKEHILRIVRFQNESTKTWKLWRYYYVGGKVVLFEDDPGSGKPVTVSLIRDNVTYDAFTRQADGSVAPLSSEELTKVKALEKELFGD